MVSEVLRAQAEKLVLKLLCLYTPFLPVASKHVGSIFSQCSGPWDLKSIIFQTHELSSNK